MTSDIPQVSSDHTLHNYSFKHGKKIFHFMVSDRTIVVPKMNDKYLSVPWYKAFQFSV